MFAPGDIVECVDDRPNPGWPRTRLVRGETYTVVALDLDPDVDGDTGVFLSEISDNILPGTVMPDGSRACGCFASRRFRLVYRPDPKLIELLQRAPAELEDA